jgi:NADPH2:quinone reductase
MNYLTCHFALRERGRIRAGDAVLVHGAAGGVGTAAVQLAKAWGARVVAVVSTDAKADVARAAGADDVVTADGFKDAVADLTSGRGVDLVVDPVGGDRLTDSLRSLAPGGRHLVIGFTAGSIPEVKVNRLLLGNLSVVGVGWGAWWTHPAGPGTGYLRRQWDELVPFLESGAIDPVVGEVRALDEVADALTAVDERRAVGKVLITP